MAQSEEVPTVVCTLTRDFWFGFSAQNNQAFHPARIGDWVPDRLRYTTLNCAMGVQMRAKLLREKDSNPQPRFWPDVTLYTPGAV